MRALKKITFKMAPTGNEVEWTAGGVSFLLDAAKTSHMFFICMPNEEEYETSRNFADVSQTITVLKEIYWDLRSKVSVSCHTMI